MNGKTILEENKSYWSGRVSGYSEVNRTELAGTQREVWKDLLCENIDVQLKDRKHEKVKVLEVGTGPGFFAIILTEAGYDVTAIDLTPEMLEEAKLNAGSLAGRIHFMEMNAQELLFEDNTFDAVISRNLTWNLPDPKAAYREWCRVLKPGGILLNFDANWYSYLFDDDAQKAYAKDRENTAKIGIKDENIGDNFDVMEDIARRVPLSNIKRPDWDIALLKGFGLNTSADVNIWVRAWSDEEKVNFASTPMFMVKGHKIN